MATGWLGWSDFDARTVPICRIELALKGRMDFVIKTNPFRSKSDDKGDAPPVYEGPMTEDRRRQVASDIASGFDRIARG